MIISMDDLKDMRGLAVVLSPTEEIQYADDVPEEFRKAASEYVIARRRVLDAWKAARENDY